MEENDVTFAYRSRTPQQHLDSPSLTNKSAGQSPPPPPLGSLPSPAVFTGGEASTLLVSVNLPELGELWGPFGGGLGGPRKASGEMETVKAKTMILEGQVWFKGKVKKKHQKSGEGKNEPNEPPKSQNSS